MQITISNVLKVSIRYTYARKINGQSVIYYQRPVPKDLHGKYPAKLIKHNLGTNDPIAASKAVDKWNRHYEAEWALLRADPSASPKAAKAQAARLLDDFGIHPRSPDHDRQGLEFFLEKLDDKRYRHAGDDEHLIHEAQPEDYLSPVEVAALDIIHNAHKDALSDALKFYLETHHKGESETLRKSSNIAMNGFIEAVGDKAIEDITRQDGRTYIKAQLARGVATTTVRRYLRSIVAILNHYFTEHEIDRKNPLAGLKIAGEGDDSEKRESFSADELKTLQTECRAADDEPRWMLAMLSDIGERLAGIGGLALDDINLDAEVPHVNITPHPWRPLDKSDATKRSVPLAGAALWAARRIKESAQKGQIYAFPSYVKDGKFNGNSASATLAKWIRSKGMDHTPHDLRHTIRDRLREVQCPEEIVHAIGGWAKTSVGQRYGKGYSLKVLLEWLQKVTQEPRP